MEVEWESRGIYRIKLADLRKACPCATCADQRKSPTPEDGLRVISDAEAAADEVRDVRTVGRYAIQVVWGDGHDAGIYPYALLRELAEKAKDTKTGD